MRCRPTNRSLYAVPLNSLYFHLYGLSELALEYVAFKVSVALWLGRQVVSMQRFQGACVEGGVEGNRWYYRGHMGSPACAAAGEDIRRIYVRMNS